MIKISGLHKYFFRHKKNEIHVLNDMTITFPDKGLVVLLGASGSGKTTLLNVIGGLDSIQKGEIVFDEQTISGYHAGVWDKIRNEKIGYIFQNYNLLPQMSVYDNVALVLKMAGITNPEIIDQRVSYILNAVNMYAFRKKKSTQLSGGQQQRVAIARALVKNPRVIIADEPTGNLDSKNTLDIMNMIKEISKEKLVILVTHEKNIAQIYGDRIIEIKDGKVINDFDNDQNHEHELSDDNIVYLKDYVTFNPLQDENIKVSVFQDNDQKIEPIEIKLIIKNRTLYLDVDSSIEKVKLLDSSSNLVIKDEHFVKKNKEEMLETAFRLENLENKNVEREYRTLVSLKQIFMLALQKILYSSKKGKLMLLSFILSGAVIAFVVAMAASTIIPDLSYRRYEDNYVYVEDPSVGLTYDELNQFLVDDSDAFINTTSSASLQIIDPLFPDKALISTSTFVDLIDYAQGSMVVGRKPVANDEFIITSTMAKEIVDSLGAEYGIWTIEHLMYEKYRLVNKELKLTGIISSDISVIYMNRTLMNLLFPGEIKFGVEKYQVYGNLSFTGKTYLKGIEPAQNQVAISNALYNELFTVLLADQNFPVLVPTTSWMISGVFESDEKFLIASDEIVERQRFGVRDEYYVYTHDTDGLVTDIQDQVRRTFDEIKYMEELFRESRLQIRITVSIVALVVIGIALLGFYFVMHSSMVSRIYEIAVYRALGMKRTELMISFLIEVIIISSVTSLIGFSLSSYGLFLLRDTLFGMFGLFKVTPLSVFVGILIVYLVNLVGGMFPILLLLRKTPAQILAQYDI